MNLTGTVLRSLFPTRVKLVDPWEANIYAFTDFLPMRLCFSVQHATRRVTDLHDS